MENNLFTHFKYDDRLPLPSQKELTLLALQVWGEARGEEYEGKIAVAFVAVNRSLQKRSTIARELLRPKQFSCFNQDDPNFPKLKRAHETKEWKSCFNAALHVYAGSVSDPTNGANHYYNPSVCAPDWAAGQSGKLIGNHMFLKL